MIVSAIDSRVFSLDLQIVYFTPTLRPIHSLVALMDCHVYCSLLLCPSGIDWIHCEENSITYMALAAFRTLTKLFYVEPG